jgi:hypothetical protein
VADLHGNLVLRLQSPLSGRTFYSCCGTQSLGATAAAILDAAARDGLTAELRLVPVEEARALEALGFPSTPDRDRFDYLLDVRRLADLRGVALRRKREQANRFSRGNRHSIRPLDLDDRSVHRALLKLRERWLHVRPGESVERSREGQLWSNGLDADWPPLERLLSAAKHFRLLGLGVYVLDRLVGFSITEQGRHGLAFAHFLKADWGDFPGSTEVVVRETARLLLAAGSTCLNYGSDDGVPGLRVTKSHLDPIGFVEKFTVRPPLARAA